MTLSEALRSMRLASHTKGFSLDTIFERWYSSLRSCLPPTVRRLLAPGDPRLIVEPMGAKARIYQVQGEQQQVLGALDPQVAGSLQAALAGVADKRHRVVVRLGAASVLMRQTVFPAQVRDNLSQVLAYEIDRLTPFQVEQVYFDYRVAEGSARGGKIGVDLALCRRDLAQEWLQRLRDAGVPAEQLTWEGAWPNANLLPAHERPHRGFGIFSPNKMLLLLVLLLVSAALGTPIWQKRQIRDERVAEAETLKARAEKVYEMRTALERARQGSVAVLQAKWDRVRMIDLLLELTQRLPDDTWVQNLDYRDGEIQVRGESAQATALIVLLDQAPGITEVTFRSPVVQVAGSGSERFHISLKYKHREEP